MEGMGNRFSGATIKDTWTKPRGLEAGEGDGDGWGGGTCWGVNADNCN